MRLLYECTFQTFCVLVLSYRHGGAEGFSNVISNRNHLDHLHRNNHRQTTGTSTKTTVLWSTVPDDVDSAKDGEVVTVDFIKNVFQNPYPSDHVGLPICEVKSSTTATTTKKKRSSSKKGGGKKPVISKRTEPIKFALPRQSPNVVEYDKEDKFFDDVETAITRTFEMEVDFKIPSISRLLLTNFREKYLYYCVDDVIYTYKGNPSERDKLLGILYTPVLALHNNYYVDFFNIWVDEVYIRDVPKKNKFLSRKDGLMEDFCYVTIKLLYTHKKTSSSKSGLW